MATTYKKHIAVIIPLEQAEEISNVLIKNANPMGHTFFASEATYIDENEKKYVFIYTPARNSFVSLANQLTSNYPEVKFFIAGELVKLDELNDSPFIWKSGQWAMKELISLETILEGLTSIKELEEEIIVEE